MAISAAAHAADLAWDNGAATGKWNNAIFGATGARTVTHTEGITGLTYTVWYSTDLSTWAEDTGAVAGTPIVSGAIETVPVTISSELLSEPALFVRVKARQALMSEA
jgi:hypothetical protein